MPRAKGTYVTLDRWVFDLAPKLPGAAGVILERLSAQSNYQQKSLTVGQLCHYLPYKERAVQNAVAYLVAEGYAEVHADTYRLRQPSASNALATRTDMRSGQAVNADSVHENEELNPAIEVHNKKEEKEEKEIEEQIKTQAQKSTAPVEAFPSQESLPETNTPAIASQANVPALDKVARRAAELPEMPADLATLPGLPAAWVEWLTYRRQRRLATAPATVQGMFVKLREFHADGQDPAAVIHNSIANGWQGLFPLRAAHVVKFNPRPQNTEQANEQFAQGVEDTIAAVRGVFG